MTHRPVDDETLMSIKENIEKEKAKLLKLTVKQNPPVPKASSLVSTGAATDKSGSKTGETFLLNSQELKFSERKSVQKDRSDEKMETESNIEIQTDVSSTSRLQRDSPMDTDTNVQDSTHIENRTDREKETESDSREIIIAGQVIRSQAQLEEVMAEMMRTEAAAMARESARAVLNPIEEQPAPPNKPLQVIIIHVL